MKIDAAELWIVRPPEPPETFTMMLGYYIHCGLDMAFGSQDTLPPEPPDDLEGIKCIMVWIEDLDRIKGKLRGFRGFNPDAEDPLSYGRLSYIEAEKNRERERAWWAQLYLHENNRTWLAVYGTECMGFLTRLESPLLLACDLTLKAPAFYQRMLARDDQLIYDTMMRIQRGSHRKEWSDITYNLGKSAMDDYALTGNQESLDNCIERYNILLENAPATWSQRSIIPMTCMARLAEITGDSRYIQYAEPILEEMLRAPAFSEGPVTGWSHATQAFSKETYEYLIKDHGDMGSYGEQMACVYLPVLSAAKVVGRLDEIADVTATAVKKMRENLRDPETGLYWHGLATRKAGHTGFMGHGTGWSAYGLVQILEIFPEKHPARGELVDMLNEICEDVVKFQGEDGSFHSILNWPFTLMNIHYTSWFGYTFLNGARRGLLPEKFVDHGRKAWEAVKIRFWEKGVISAAAGNPVSRQMHFYMERNNFLRFDSFSKGGGSQGIFLLQEIMRLK